MNKTRELMGKARAFVALNRSLSRSDVTGARRIIVGLQGRWEMAAAKWAIRRHQRRLDWEASALDRWSSGQAALGTA